MKRIFTAIVLGGLCYWASAQRSNCSVYPYPNTLTQKDGSKLTLTARGTETESYLETAEGYTVLVNASGVYEYAVVDASGNLVPGGVQAKDIANFSGKTAPEKHLRYSTLQKAILQELFKKLNAENNGNQLGKAGPQGFPTKGVNKVCVLLIEYPDLRATVAKSVFENLFNQVNYNGTGSFRDYYMKTSFGQLTLNCDVYGWYMATGSYLDYGKNNANYGTNTRNLVRRAVDAADSAGVDFSKYDNDSDGMVDGLLLLHAGIGAEEQSAPNANNYIWSFRSSLGGGGYNTSSGTRVNSFCFFPEKRYSGGTYPVVGIGVISHEFGHLLDLPDLYSTQDNGEGAGNYSNMAGGPWLNGEKTPCMFDAWSKMKMEWHTPTLITKNGTYTIPKPAADSNFSYRINTAKSTEYFLIENKQQRGFDRYVPSKGLAIWHISESTAGLLSSKGNNANNDTARYGVGLMQADGNRQLERGINRGDAGDLFPGSTNNKSFTDFTNPSSKLYPNTSGVRVNTNISITNITLNADSSMTFTIGGSKAVVDFSASTIQGCAPLAVSFDNKTVFASSYLWTFGNGDTSTRSEPNYTYITQGNYTVQLVAYDSLGIPADSLSIGITVYNSPKASFKVVRSDSNTFTFTSTSADAQYVTWKFGTAGSTVEQAPTVQFTGTGQVEVQMIAYNGQCTDTATTVLDLFPLGLTKEQAIASQIFPNPFTNELVLSFNLIENTELTVSMFDMLGKCVVKIPAKMYAKGKTELKLDTEVASFTEGIYFIELRSADSISNNKVIKTSR